MAKAPPTFQKILITALVFLTLLVYAWYELDQRPVNDKGWASAWLEKQTWLLPLANHQSFGQYIFNSKQLMSVFFATAQHGWAVGNGGVILATADGGQSWKQQASQVKTNLNYVHFADAQHGWAVGDDGVILATTDGGQSKDLKDEPHHIPHPNQLATAMRRTNPLYGRRLPDRQSHTKSGFYQSCGLAKYRPANVHGYELRLC